MKALNPRGALTSQSLCLSASCPRGAGIPEKPSPLLSQAVGDLLEPFIIPNTRSDMFLRGGGTQALVFECALKRRWGG